MKTATVLIRRNVKLFFKDKGMFFTALITPVILLVLYVTFLGQVYRDSFQASLPEFVTISDRVTDGLVGSQLISSILAVSCVTVAFCSNFLSVQDKALGTARDFRVSPVSPSVISVSYYAATLISTLLVCLCATGLCLGYVAIIGWYLSVSDVLLLLLDVLLLVLFGTALSSIINLFLSTQGQIAAVGSVVSSGYGFLCGAYMPLASFSEGLRTVISVLPGTYGTALVRNHSMRGVFAEMEKEGLPGEVVESLKDALDCNLYFFENSVSIGVMYAVLILSILILIGVYVLLHRIMRKNGK